VAEGIGGLGKWAQGMRHAPLQLTTGQRGVRRVQTLWHERAVPQMRQAYSGITLGFVVKVCALLAALLAGQPNGHVCTPLTCQAEDYDDEFIDSQQANQASALQLALLWLLRRRAPKALPFLEFTSLAIPLTEALARWQVTTQSRSLRTHAPAQAHCEGHTHHADTACRFDGLRCLLLHYLSSAAHADARPQVPRHAAAGGAGLAGGAQRVGAAHGARARLRAAAAVEAA
jgi:hypothetical protein